MFFIKFKKFFIYSFFHFLLDLKSFLLNSCKSFFYLILRLLKIIFKKGNYNIMGLLVIKNIISYKVYKKLQGIKLVIRHITSYIITLLILSYFNIKFDFKVKLLLD